MHDETLTGIPASTLALFKRMTGENTLVSAVDGDTLIVACADRLRSAPLPTIRAEIAFATIVDVLVRGGDTVIPDTREKLKMYLERSGFTYCEAMDMIVNTTEEMFRNATRRD